MMMEADGLTRSLLVGVNTASDLRNPTHLEQRHLPVIEAPPVVRMGEPFSATVEVGKVLPHPNEPGHFIQSIDLYADALLLARLDLTAGGAWPAVTVTLSLRAPARCLRALARCNMHGTWAGETEITFEA